MSSKYTPFRYDYVGSFLRPESLKKARADFEAGKITKEALTKAEDEAILDLVEKQKKAGAPVYINTVTYEAFMQLGDDGQRENQSVDGHKGQKGQNRQKARENQADTIEVRIAKWDYSAEQIEELKKAIQAEIPKEKLLEIFYPDVRVEEMRTFRMAYKKGMKND